MGFGGLRLGIGAPAWAGTVHLRDGSDTVCYGAAADRPDASLQFVIAFAIMAPIVSCLRGRFTV